MKGDRKYYYADIYHDIKQRRNNGNNDQDTHFLDFRLHGKIGFYSTCM